MGWAIRILLLAVIGVAALFVAFAASLPSPTNTRVEAIHDADGIVVPTGGIDRIASGLDLLAAGGSRLLITGVHPDTNLAAVLATLSRPAPECCVDIEHLASNTAANAVAARAWANAHAIQRIHLVTSWYHMPRSHLLFSREMPEITIVPHPVWPESLGNGRWWLSGRGWALVVLEFGKYLWARLGFGAASWV